MTRNVLLAAFLIGGLFGSAFDAQADIDTWTSTRKQPRSDAALQADTDYCNQTVGQNRNGRPTPPQFKRCMLGRGWRFSHTTREHTWTDPETGLLCKEIKVFGVTGSECSNF
jgi:hypothetical protein